MGGTPPRPGCSRRDRVTPTEPPLLRSLQWEMGWKTGMFSKVSRLGRVGGSGQPRDSRVPQPSGPGESPVPLHRCQHFGFVHLCMLVLQALLFLSEKLQMELCGDFVQGPGGVSGGCGGWGVPVNQVSRRVLGAFLGSVSCSGDRSPGTFPHVLWHSVTVPVSPPEGHRWGRAPPAPSARSQRGGSAWGVLVLLTNNCVLVLRPCAGSGCSIWDNSPGRFAAGALRSLVLCPPRWQGRGAVGAGGSAQY